MELYLVSKPSGSLDYFRMVAALLVIAIHTSPLASCSAQADFILTRIIARVAVPFFLMITGRLLLPQYIFGKSMDNRPFVQFVRKTLCLYAAAIGIFLPVNLYAGQLAQTGSAALARMLLFDGTFYHLWYLPASVTGALLIWILGKKIGFRGLFGICLALYGFGLLGDSYYGFIRSIPVCNKLYDALFHIFSYTRNGIFYAPIFLLMGAWFGRASQNRKRINDICGLLVSLLFMILEGLSLHIWGIPRHDSMYLFLLPCMFFLFSVLLSVPKRPVPALRGVTTWIYLLHPWMIILVRGAAKITHCERILINNHLIHFIAVCLLSGFLAAMIGTRVAVHKPRPLFNGRAWIELDKKSLRQNVAVLQKLLPPGCRLMPVVKANAYGHGAVLIAKALNEIGIFSFCVASLAEGIELRKGGVCGKILILGYTQPQDIPFLKKFHLMQTVIDYRYAKLLNAYGKPVQVHVKIDTGMHRLGERAEHIEEIAEIFHMENLIVEGVFTHLCADESTAAKDRLFTESQGKVFYHAISALEERGCSCRKIHVLASYGLIHYPEFGGDYARVGIALYGILSNRKDLQVCKIPLLPVLSLKARIAAIKDLFCGESVGYGLAYTAEENRKIAILPIGYADGIPRALSCGNGSVLVNGQSAPVIGRICMDQTMIDITDIPGVKEGDIAVLIGRSGDAERTVYDLAEQVGTITNEIVSRLGPRLDRIVGCD